ncbi:MATE family efflux transporter [Natrialbaceae archaeon A-CW2]|uniref:MATE family efflux transporter n=1 Tax=Natronosalvus amylolyticus TaxID=2961994 RepID=UPI0020C9C1FC|nr:MATE family efflux transporter [Natronosalvus amylolyticus]
MAGRDTAGNKSDQSLHERVRAVWIRVLALAWPIMAEQTTRTLMRTVDIIVTGLLSPAAIAAIGLADLYARLPLRIGLGLGGGAIALSSQDTGSGATDTRDEAITQAVLLGAVAGIPFVIFGFLLSELAIEVLGAEADVVTYGAIYLAIIMATAPARHVSIIAGRALQGTGDTVSPMVVNVIANLLNVSGSVVLGLGLFGAPRLEVVGVGLATAVANVFTALALCVVIAGPWREAGFVRPTDPVIARQLLTVSAPRVAEGMVATAIEFPFNSILLMISTEANAAYQIGRRVYQQFSSPLSRGYNVAASIVVGQYLGEGDPAEARFNGWAIAGLGLATVGVIGILLAIFAETFVSVFTSDPKTADHAVTFAQVYGISAPLLVVYIAIAGSLQGASETTIPFLARASGLFLWYLCFSYIAAIQLGYGVVGVAAGIFLYYLWALLVVAWGYHSSDWAGKAARMMAERGSVSDD